MAKYTAVEVGSEWHPALVDRRIHRSAQSGGAVGQGGGEPVGPERN